MRKLFLLIMILGSFTGSSYSQDYFQTIKGKVIDRDSKETLIGATVVLENSSPLNGTITDINGNFRLERVSSGRHTVKVSYVGYKEMIIPEINVVTGKETVLTVELTQSVIQVKGVQITASSQDKDKSLNTMASISARKINMDDAVRYAGGFSDAARMVSSFAGVSPVEGDGVNDIIIRGNTPRGLLWRLEGIEIPNPNHFTDGQGGTGGAFSIITSNVLSTSDFLTGAFPAEYGNAYSGIMDLYLRKGNEEKREYAFQLSVVGTEASMEGPISRKNGSSYLINYRYSTFGYLSDLNIIDLGDNNLPPVFQDLALNLTFPTKKSGTFTFFTVGGQSTTGTEPVKDSALWVGNEGKFYETEDHRMGIAGLKHFFLFPDKKTSLKTVVAATYQDDKWNSGLLDKNYANFNEYDDCFAYPSFRTSIILNSKLNARNVIRSGIIHSSLFYQMFMREYSYDQGRYDTMVDKDGNSQMLQAFIQWKHRLTDQFEVNTGLHYITMALNNHASFEPRIGLKWTITPRGSLNAGVGLHSRAESLPFYLALIPQPGGGMKEDNRNLDFAKAVHFIVGYDYSLSRDWRIKAEAYYQQLFNIPVEDATGSKLSALNYLYGIPDIRLINEGKGYNYGFELTLEKFYTENYYCLATVSLFDSRFKANDGKWYNTVFNSGYVTNLLLGKDFKCGHKKQNIFGLNIKTFMRGGYRISPIDRVKSLEERDVVFDETDIYSDQLPSFYRADLGTYLRINALKKSYIISIDIQNITNRKNTLGYDFSDKENDIVPVEGLGIVPILNFRLEF